MDKTHIPVKVLIDIESGDILCDTTFPQTRTFQDTCIEVRKNFESAGDSGDCVEKASDIIDTYKLVEVSLTKDQLKDWHAN